MKTPEEMAEEYAECLFSLAFSKAYGASPAEMLKMHNSKLPKDARAAALHHFIKKFEGEYVDIPIASDAKGSLRYSRYKLIDFFEEYMSKTPEKIIFAAIEELKKEIKYCDKSIDIRIVQSAIKKIAKVLKGKSK